MNILLNLDGVLSSDTGEPIPTGIALYYALTASHRVSIITAREKSDAEHWLHSHGIINYDDLVDKRVGLEGDDLKKRQFKAARHGAPVELYVDTDPAMCAWVFETQRITSVLVSHPSYAKIENRPDAPKSMRTWDQIVEAVDRVNVAKAKERMAPNTEIGEYSD